MPVERIGAFLQSCHALLIPLRDHTLLDDFIPSKLYDAMAVGRPVIVAAGREAAELVEQTGCGLVIPPEDGTALADASQRLAADARWQLRSPRLGAAPRRSTSAHDNWTGSPSCLATPRRGRRFHDARNTRYQPA